MEPLELAKAVRPYLEAAGLEVNVEALLLVMPPMRVRLKRFTDAIDFLRFLGEESPLPAKRHRAHAQAAATGIGRHRLP
ncbi:MAG: hypothetical protein IPJ90_07480 [Anaerolineaceae bacterium]|nr:hypothetical protein [Anaerolineaceae bacterium]